MVTLFPEEKEEDDNDTSLREMIMEHSSKGCVGGAVKCILKVHHYYLL